MKDRKEKYLFIIPTASINGAIIILMNFLEYMSKNSPGTHMETIVQWGKDQDPDTFFRSELEKYGPVTFLMELWEDEKIQLKNRILNEQIDVIFYNSIISIDSQLLFKEKQCKKIFYVHEMERLLNLFNLKNHSELYNHKDNLFFAGSESVRQDLIRIVKIPGDRITVLHSFINTEEIKNKMKPLVQLEKYDVQYKMEKRFTIGFSGTFELRKSADLLLPLVVAIRKKIKDPDIFWIGASPFNYETSTFDLVMHDVKTGGFESNINFIPKTRDCLKYYQRFDVYVILSREDPFPVVNVEMGLLGIPVICFDNSGGSPDYTKMGGGVSVPYMDLGAMADKIYEFYMNPELLQKYKKNAPPMVENNFSVEVQAPKLLDKIKEFIKEN